jgi:hypothetical protein
MSLDSHACQPLAPFQGQFLDSKEPTGRKKFPVRSPKVQVPHGLDVFADAVGDRPDYVRRSGSVSHHPSGPWRCRHRRRTREKTGGRGRISGHAGSQCLGHMV